jgi:hypothetical protein
MRVSGIRRSFSRSRGVPDLMKAQKTSSPAAIRVSRWLQNLASAACVHPQCLHFGAPPSPSVGPNGKNGVSTGHDENPLRRYTDSAPSMNYVLLAPAPSAVNRQEFAGERPWGGSEALLSERSPSGSALCVALERWNYWNAAAPSRVVRARTNVPAAASPVRV